MNYVISFFIFCIVLFLYLHIYHHLKTSNDLEVYEIEEPSKEKLEEICDIRQPVIFQYPNVQIMEKCELSQIVETYSAFDVKVRDVKNIDDTNELYLPLTLHEVIELLRNDGEHKYISENNADFLEETALIKEYKYNDFFLRPPMVSSCQYDLLMGGNGTTTPLRYSMNYRNYYLVTNGSITIKLFNPDSSKYLSEKKDYDHFEFTTSLNPWDVQEQYKADYNKVKSLTVTLKEGDIIYIPAYWWYSIKYNNVGSVCAFKYRTYMNTLAISHHIGLCLLQRSNVQRKFASIRKKTEPENVTATKQNSK